MSTLVAAPPSTARKLLPPAPLDRASFLDAYGVLPRVGEELIAELAQARLGGRGGAGFPTARKLETVRAAGGGVVVANGTEGEPTSWKDGVLIARNPHLVIDGALAAARLVEARRVVFAVSRRGPAGAALERALAERRDVQDVEVAALPERFVSGEESALVHWLNDGEAKPTSTPPRVFERGVGRRPTLVQNVETLAALALAARGVEPQTMLATVSGAVAHPGVVEVTIGTPFAELLARCGGLTEPVQAFLTGGYFGRFIPPDPTLRLDRESISAAGGSLGAGVVLALGERVCGITEVARAARWLAGQSAEQCGPCLFGLKAVAGRLDELARCDASARQAVADFERLERQIARRGACAFPDGVLGFVASGLRVFGAEVDAHLAGRCSAGPHAPVLPVPATEGGWR